MSLLVEGYGRRVTISAESHPIVSVREPGPGHKKGCAELRGTDLRQRPHFGEVAEGGVSSPGAGMELTISNAARARLIWNDPMDWIVETAYPP